MCQRVPPRHVRVLGYLSAAAAGPAMGFYKQVIVRLSKKNSIDWCHPVPAPHAEYGQEATKYDIEIEKHSSESQPQLPSLYKGQVVRRVRLCRGLRDCVLFR